MNSMKDRVDGHARRASARNDDRVFCPHCDRRTLPFVVSRYGSPTRSICRHCGTTLRSFVPWGPLCVLIGCGLMMLFFYAVFG
jgi:hypothetical protein